MRLVLTLTAAFTSPEGRSVIVPVDHQDLLQAALYTLLEAADPTFARSVHDLSSYKPFVFSGLRTDKANRRFTEGGQLQFRAGAEVQWHLDSPLPDFMACVANGIFTVPFVRVGAAAFRVERVDALPTPSFEEARPYGFTCLTPIVASVPVKQQKTASYLVPNDGELFSISVRSTLVNRFETVYGRPPRDDSFSLTFDAAYLAKHKGTKLVRTQDIAVRGAFAPFVVKGSAELLQLAYENGLGSRTGNGFGMIQADLTGSQS